MTSLLAVLIVLVLTVWFGTLVVQFGREISGARRRFQNAWDKEQKLHVMIEHLLGEEKRLDRQIEDETQANTELEKQIEAARAELARRLSSGGNRLQVMGSRRQPGEKDWIVTLVNPTLARTEPRPPLADEWGRGRDYLVWARSEQEARERALRRFSARPGVAVRTVVPAPPELLTGETAEPPPHPATVSPR